MDIHKQTQHNVGNCLLYGSKFAITWSTTRIRWGWLPIHLRFRMLFTDDRSKANTVGHDYSFIWGTYLIVLNWPTALCLELRQIVLRQISWWHEHCNQHLKPPDRVAYIDEPHTMHGAHHTTGFRCIHEQSGCKWPHQVLGSPWARSAIWREQNYRHWKESKTSIRGQC